MSVKIRLQKTGRHKDPHFRVVVLDSRKRRDGKVIEHLGHYHPKLEEDNAVIDLEKLDKWLSKGAQMTDTVKSLVAKIRRSGSKEEA